MLAIMKAKLDAGRSLLYQTSRYVDIYKALDDIARERKLTPEERQEQKKYAKLADAFTPLAKGMNSEYANQNAYGPAATAPLAGEPLAKRESSGARGEFL